MKVKEYIAKKIRKLGIKSVPVFQGGAIMHVIDAIGETKNLNYFVPYHEQSLSMCVDGYSRINGFGIGCVTSGPGATNLITGVCCSYYDSIPCLFFTGQVGLFHVKKSSEIRQRGFQETDVAKLFAPITKFSYQIKDVNEIDYIIDKAIYIAKNGRPGPVVIDLPFNIQIADINLKKLKRFKKPKNVENKKNTYNKIKQILDTIQSNKKVAFIAGGGLRISKTYKEFNKFSKKLNIPFVTTWASQDITTYDDKLYFGSIGRHAHESANEVISSADLLVTFGFRFAPKAINENFKKNKSIKIISIDVDKFELNESIIKIDQRIHLDLKIFFKYLKKFKLKKMNNKSWIDTCRKYKKLKYLNNLKFNNNFINPYLFMNLLSNKMEKNSIIFADTGANLCWLMQSFNITINQRIISAWGNSPMGYSICAAIGGSIENRFNKTFAIIGDGGFMMNVQELQFLKHRDLNLKIIVFDNEGLGNTKLGTKSTFNNRTHANDKEHGYFPADLKSIVESYKLKYFFVKSNDSASNAIDKIIKTKGNAVLHVKISSETDVIDHTIKRLNSIYKL